MSRFRNGSGLRHHCLGDTEFALISKHGLRSNGVRYVTIALGVGGQNRLTLDEGSMKQIGVVECTICQKSVTNRLLRLGPYRDWYHGHTAKEKHWHIDRSDPSKTVGLRLRCFYSVYMDLLRQARLAYKHRDGPTESSLAKHGRIGLVSVSLDDILSVEEEGPTGNLELAPAPYGGIALTVRKLKVIGLIDQLPLVPSESFLDALQNAPLEWHRRWHHLVDAIQPESWRDFPTKLAATFQEESGLLGTCP